MALKVPPEQRLELWVLTPPLDVLDESIADHVAHGRSFDVGDSSSLIGQSAINAQRQVLCVVLCGHPILPVAGLRLSVTARW